MDSNSHRRLSFFLAGTMQGSRPGAQQISQSYRALLTEVIRRHRPNAEVLCPLEQLAQRLGAEQGVIRDSHAALASLTRVRRADFAKPLLSLTQTFVSLSQAAGAVDVLIAYLPDHEASMGTAIEMWNAFSNGVTVIAITPMRQNLAVMSTSDVILPDIAALDALFSEGFFDTILPRGLASTPLAEATATPARSLQ